MRTSLAVTLAVLFLGACSHDPGKQQSTLNEATTTTGTGNTAGSFNAAGPAANTQSAKENARR